MAFPEQPFDEREKVREILQNTWVTGRKALAHEVGSSKSQRANQDHRS